MNKMNIRYPRVPQVEPRKALEVAVNLELGMRIQNQIQLTTDPDLEKC